MLIQTILDKSLISPSIFTFTDIALIGQPSFLISISESLLIQWLQNLTYCSNHEDFEEHRFKAPGKFNLVGLEWTPQPY